MVKKTTLLTLLGLLGTAWAQKPVGPPCPKSKTVEVHLTAGEFKIPAYDARRGLVAVRPMTDLLPGLVRDYSVRLLLARPEVLMPIGAESLSFGLETGASDLELVVEGEPAVPAEPPAAEPDCAALRVRSIRLERRGVVLSRRVLAQPVASRAVQVKVFTRLHVEQGSAQAPVLETEGRALTEGCIQRALQRTHAIQGALSLQLAKTILGQPEAPKIVVDGLVNEPLSNCLITAFRDARRVWSSIEPASRVYLTLYLRGAVEDSKAAAPVGVEPAVLRRGE